MGFSKGFLNIQDMEERKILRFAFLVSLIGRIAVILLLGQDQYLYEYGSIAQNIVAGNGFAIAMFPPATMVQETCVMSPVYPYLLALCYLLFGINTAAIAAVQIVQSVVGAATVYPLYHLAKDIYSKKVAVLSILIFTLYPDFLHWSYLIQQITLTTFSVVTVVYLFHLFNKESTFRRSIGLGVFAGFSLLIDTVIIAILGLFFLWILFTIFKQWFTLDKQIPRDLKLKMVGLFLAVGVCGVVIAPWEYRCLTVYDGQFVFIKASGFNLWWGNNPNFTETGIPPWITADVLLEMNQTTEGAIDGALGQLALSYMMSHPFETISNSGRKFIEFWWFPQAFPEESPLLRQIIYALLLLFAIVTLLIGRKKLGAITLLLLPLIAFSILYSVVFVLGHHRLPIQPILIILSARGIEYMSGHPLQGDS